MPKVTDITVLNIDEKPYAVESLTKEVQDLVEVYNEWNRKQADVRDELTRFQAAMETLSRQIITKVREHLSEKEAAAQAAAEAEADSSALETTEAPTEESSVRE